MRYISPERKVSSKIGTGIQYIPGHVEPFMDHVVGNYLPQDGEILDLGGGGLRFAIPVALVGRSITVIDLDSDSLNVSNIVALTNCNGKVDVDLSEVQKKIHVKTQDTFTYLRETEQRYSLITAFRLIHFFSPDELSEFFRLVRERLVDRNGVLVFSALTPFNSSDPKYYNEFFLQTKPVKEDYPLYRRFEDADSTYDLRAAQNLPGAMHFVDKAFVREIAQECAFEVIEEGLRSTRTVEGFIMRTVY